MLNTPNILLITTDQHRGDCLGFAGRKVMTPHLDRMAEEGTVFTGCITPNVICQPARASLLTGLLPLTNGIYDNGIDLPDEVGEAGFAGSLSKSGYHTACLGKAHFKSIYTFDPTGTPECQQSMQNYESSWHGPYMGFEYIELIVEGHNRYPPAHPPSGQHYEHWFYADGLGDDKNELHRTRLPPDTGAPQTWNSALPSAWHNSTWVADRTIEYLSRRQSEPFCAWVSFPDPHSPFDCPAPWCYLHDLDEVDLPKNPALDLERRPWWHAANLENPDIFADPRITNVAKAEQRLANKPRGYSRIAPKDERQLRHVIANYYGMISLVDHNIGRILAKLHDLGLSENTIIMFTADHGEWLGDHGLIQKGPMHYEGLLCIPLILRGPGIPAAQQISDPVSLIDIAATLVDLAHASPLQEMHGKSLRPLLSGSDHRDYALNEWDLEPWRYGVNKQMRFRTVRTKTHKLTLELESNTGEFYDLANDPLEMNNLFGDKGFVKIESELKEMIRARPNDEMQRKLPRAGL